MIKDYLKAGYPTLCILTQEPHRAEKAIICDGWRFVVWDCINGIRETGTSKIIEEVRDPVEAIKWLNVYRDTVLCASNLHLFLEIPEVIQAIQNGITLWKGIGSALVMISPIIQLRPEVEKFFTIVDLPLPDDETLINLQKELCTSVTVNPQILTIVQYWKIEKNHATSGKSPFKHKKKEARYDSRTMRR